MSSPNDVIIAADDVQELHDVFNKLAALQKTLHHPGLGEAVAELGLAIVRIVPRRDEPPASLEPAAAIVKDASNEPAKK